MTREPRTCPRCRREHVSPSGLKTCPECDPGTRGAGELFPELRPLARKPKPGGGATQGRLYLRRKRGNNP